MQGGHGYGVNLAGCFYIGRKNTGPKFTGCKHIGLKHSEVCMGGQLLVWKFIWKIFEKLLHL